jgi:hypothetical protein
MGEAKRRAKARGDRRQDEILARANQMHVEGQGLWQMEIVFQQDIPVMLLRAKTSRSVRTRFSILANAIGQMPRMQPSAMCLLCDHAFIEDAPAAFVLLTAAIDGPTQGIVNGLCVDCASQDDLQGRIAEKYKDMMVDGLRVLPSPAAPGQA